MPTVCIILLSIFALLNLVDVFLTHYAVQVLGVRERNQFMRFIVHRTGIVGMLLVKALVITFAVLIEMAAGWSIWPVMVMIAMILAVCFWNMGVICGLRQKIKEGA